MSRYFSEKELERNNKFVKMEKQDFESYLLEKYPHLFKNLKEDIYKSCMGWGLEVDSGWYWVIDLMAEKLENVRKVSGVSCVFDQIKEKFGTSRFYYHGSFDFNNSKIKRILYYNFIYKIFPSIEIRHSLKLNVISDFIGRIVGEHESICDSTDSISGLPIKPHEKLVIGYWYHSYGIDSYENIILSNENSSAEQKENLIQQARCFVLASKKRKEIKNVLDRKEIGVEDLSKILDFIDKIVKNDIQ
jgi:hypothetical protein